MRTFSVYEDLRRYKEIGEDEREDMKDFIKYDDIGYSDEKTVRIPIKIVELPEFKYEQKKGGIGKKGMGDDPGDEKQEPQYEEMEAEKFAEIMEEILDLDLEPKGKESNKVDEGDYVERSRSGPDSTLVKDKLFKRGLKRKLSLHYDEEYCRELLKVKGVGPKKAFEILRNRNINVNYEFLEKEYEDITKKWESLEEFDKHNEPEKPKMREENVEMREEDEIYHYPEEDKEKEESVVVVNIRDISGSMGKNKRDLIQRVFAPIDWTLAGKYDNAEFVYIAHNLEAFEVDREEFFNMQSGGGTKISSAYELTKEILDKNYPWDEWNRYVLGGGDGENSARDSKKVVPELMREIDANLHAYLQVSPSRGGRHLEILEDKLEIDNFVGVEVNKSDEVLEAIETVFRGDIDG